MSSYADQNSRITLNSRLGFSEYSSRIKALDVAVKCVELGLFVYQISGDLVINFPKNISGDERKQLRQYNNDHDLRLHFHAPTDIPLASRHEKLRLSGVDSLCEFIELALECGAKSFIFHPGRFAYYRIGSGQVVVANKNIPEIYFERFYDSVTRLAKCADGEIDLLLENTYDFSDSLIEIVDRFLGLQSTGLVWDIGHMQRSMMISKRNKIDPNHIADFFSRRLEHIKLAHIHDINAGKGHLPLGTGSLNLAPFLEVLSNLDIDMIIEVFSENDLKASIEYIDSLTVQSS